MSLTNGDYKWTPFNIAAGCFGLSIYIIYHIYFLFTILFRKKSGCRINLVINLRARRRWVEYIMLTKGSEVTGIQAIRNSIMYASFFATGTTTSAFFVINIINNGVDNDALPLYYGISVALLFAFTAFSLAIRDYGHASFLISCRNFDDKFIPQLKSLYQNKKQRTLFQPKGLKEEAIDSCPLTKQLNNNDPATQVSHESPRDDNDSSHSSIHPTILENISYCNRLLFRATVGSTFGLRCFFFGILIAFWLLNPIVIIIGSITIVCVVMNSDLT